MDENDQVATFGCPFCGDASVGIPAAREHAKVCYRNPTIGAHGGTSHPQEMEKLLGDAGNIIMHGCELVEEAKVVLGNDCIDIWMTPTTSWENSAQDWIERRVQSFPETYSRRKTSA